MMHEEPCKVCPECGGEYRPDIEICADCAVPLVHPEEIARRDARELKASSRLVALREAPIPWARALVEDLARQGIGYRVDRRRARDEGRLTVYVERQRWEEAREVDEARRRLEAPQQEDAAAIDLAAAPARVLAFPAEPDHKVCPECGAEFRLEIERCSDCGVALVLPGEEVDPPVDEGSAPERDLETSYHGPAEELEDSDDLVCVSCRSVGSLTKVSWALNDAGIAHRLESAPFASLDVGCLYTRPEDADRAAAIDAGLWRIPYDGELADDLTACPACGTPHPQGARECAECGLAIGAAEDVLTFEEPVCGRCGAVVGIETSRCPNCGGPMAPG